MKTTSLFRAVLAGAALAACGAAQAQFDDDLHAAGPQTQTWFFPDGSSHTVRVTNPTEQASLRTTAMGGPPSVADEDSAQASNTVTQTWFFPDGTSRTVTFNFADPGPHRIDVATLTP